MMVFLLVSGTYHQGRYQQMRKLTDSKIKTAKIPKEKDWHRFPDGEGLSLRLVRLKDDGIAKYWRKDYRFNGKQLTLAIGVYPPIIKVDVSALT